MKILRKLSIVFILGLVTGSVFGQTTSVTATIVDTDGFTWVGAQVTVNFLPNPSFPNINQYTLAGQNLATYQPYNSLLSQKVTADPVTGAIAVTLLDNTQIQPAGSTWSFSIKSNTSAPSTLYNPVQLFGSTFNLSSYLSTNAVAPRFPAQPGTYAYGDVELTTTPNPGGTYFDTSNLTTRQWNGNAWGQFAGGASGVNSINTFSGNFVFTGAVNCVVGPPPTCTFTGGAGGGFNLNVSEMGALATGMTTITHTNHYVVPLAQTSSQVNALIATYSNPTLEFQGSEIPVAFRNQNWTAKISHQGLVFTTFKKNIDENGVICDARTVLVNMTNGSRTITISSNTMSSLDIGKLLWTYDPTTNQAYETQIQTVPTSTQITVATAAPFTETADSWIGTDNSTTMQDAITDASNSMVINGSTYPTPAASLTLSSGACMTHNLNPKGVSMEGAGVLSEIVSPPGEDTFATPDAFTSGGQPQILVHDHDFSITLHGGVDITKQWQLTNDSGQNNIAAVNRSAYVMTKNSNYPFSPEWIIGTGPNGSGGFNGIATTNGTAVICVLSATLPIVGQEIMFPYASGGLIETTVSSTAGTCGTGTPRTLAASIPALAQAEFFEGTNIQHTAVAMPAGRSYPFTLVLANSIYPTPASEIGMAPYGLIQIGNEQCSYYNIDFGFISINMTITGCTGTSVLHSSGVFIAPLNPFFPTKPWPYFPTLNTNDTTPSGAELFPGHNIGNCAFAFPQSNGSANQANAWANSSIENISILQFDVPAFNNTCAFYFVGLPYATHFRHIQITNTEYGIVEATPPIQNHNWAGAQPTSDGTTWDGISIHAGYIFDIITGGQNNMSNFDTYSNLGTLSGSFVGSAGAFYFTNGWDDQTGGAISCYSNSETNNLYVEPEGGSHGEQEALVEADQCNATNLNWHLGGGGFVYLSGLGNKFIGGNFNNTGNFGAGAAPVINYTHGLSLEGVQLVGTSPNCNTFVFTASVQFPCTFLNWGPQTRAIVQQDKIGPYTNIAYGARSDIRAQTGEAFLMGGPLFTSSEGGFIHPEEFGIFDVSNQWTFDSTALVTQSYVGCFMTVTTGVCQPSRFNNSAGISIGPNGRIPNAKTYMYASFKSGLSSNTFSFGVAVLCPSQTILLSPQAVFPVNTWPATLNATFQATVDFTNYSGCLLQLLYTNASNTDTIYTQFVDFTPIPANFQAQQLSLNGTGQPTIQLGSNGGETWQTAAPTTGCGSTYTNGFIWHNTAGNHGATSLTYVCNAASTSWIGVF